MVDIATIRMEYARAGLAEEDLAPSPTTQFERWLDEAIGAQVNEPTAITLATASADGEPNARVVLLKGIDGRGFTFFTSYVSAKGRELDANPRAVLVAFWSELQRQVRVSGRVERLTREESEAYFRTRPLGSRLGAWASQQSDVIASRAVIEARFADLERQYASGEVPLPPFWGGYRVTPSWVEFWQGRPSRLHDRLRYTRIGRAGEGADDSWRVDRLSP